MRGVNTDPSPYMDIVQHAESSPKAYIMTSGYLAQIAATCVRSLAKTRGIGDLHVIKTGKTLLVWRSIVPEIRYVVPERPKKTRGRPVGSVRRTRFNDGFGTYGMRERGV